MGELYSFADEWLVPYPIELAWRMVDDVAAWPSWWPDYRSVELLSPDRPHGTGSRWRMRVRSNLPYTVDFAFVVLEHRAPNLVRTQVEGFFNGTIDWRLEEDGEGATRMVLNEETETRWLLINLAARIGGRRFLELNHAKAMGRGREGMLRALARGYLPPDLDRSI